MFVVFFQLQMYCIFLSAANVVRMTKPHGTVFSLSEIEKVGLSFIVALKEKFYLSINSCSYSYCPNSVEVNFCCNIKRYVH